MAEILGKLCMFRRGLPSRGWWRLALRMCLLFSPVHFMSFWIAPHTTYKHKLMNTEMEMECYVRTIWFTPFLPGFTIERTFLSVLRVNKM